MKKSPTIKQTEPVTPKEKRKPGPEPFRIVKVYHSPFDWSAIDKDYTKRGL